ncbi:38K protein [Aratus pisonii nudivirus]|nr:38K protein [Aratus pisonii nudivirus]
MRNGVFVEYYTNKKSCKKFQNIIELCNFYFTHIYIISNRIITLNMNEITNKLTNDDLDPSGIYYIEVINNNIKYYSVKLNLNNDDDDINCHRKNVHVDYININLDNNYNKNNLNNEIYNNLQIFYKNNKTCKKSSVAVIDLDETIIDSECNIKLDNLHVYLTILNKVFDKVILWSHGCNSHVNHCFSTNLLEYKPYFCSILSKSSKSECKNKGIGFILKHLNLNYDICELKSTILIDDQKTNYNKDYDFFIHAPSSKKYFNERMWKMLIQVKNLAFKNIKF